MPTKDIRSKRPNINLRRRGNFRLGWSDALKGQAYKERDGITWQSAGNSCGQLLRQQPTETQNAIYELLVKFHTAQHVPLK